MPCFKKVVGSNVYNSICEKHFILPGHLCLPDAFHSLPSHKWEAGGGGRGSGPLCVSTSTSERGAPGPGVPVLQGLQEQLQAKDSSEWK